MHNNDTMDLPLCTWAQQTEVFTTYSVNGLKSLESGCISNGLGNGHVPAHAQSARDALVPVSLSPSSLHKRVELHISIAQASRLHRPLSDLW